MEIEIVSTIEVAKKITIVRIVVMEVQKTIEAVTGENEHHIVLLLIITRIILKV